TFEVLDDHLHRRVFHEAAEARLAGAKRHLGLLAVADVHGHAANGNQRAVGVSNRELDLVAPFFPEVGELYLPRHRIAGLDYFAVHGLDDRNAGARGHIADPAAEDFARESAPARLDSAIDHLVATVQILYQHAEGRVLHETAEARLAGLQRQFCLLPVADVDGDAANGDHAAGGVLDRELHFVVPPFAEIGEVNLSGHHSSGLDDFAVHRFDVGDGGTRRDIADAPPENLLCPPPPASDHAAIDHHVATIEILHQHAEGRVVHETAEP